MHPRSLIKLAPSAIKHPLITWTRWYWDAMRLPAQTTRDIQVLKDILTSVETDVLKVWEWGAGKSTIYYAKFLHSIGRQFEWHAIDNSPSWYERCEDALSGTPFEDQVHLHCREFPAFWQLPDYSINNPVPAESWNDSEAVFEYVNLPTTLEFPFDVIIIDGRYRRRCLLAAKEALAKGGTVYLHDAQREWYYPSLSVYGKVDFSETGIIPGTKQASKIAVCRVSK